MSAKGRGTKPIANDAYPTPPWAVHRLLEAGGELHQVFTPGAWIEPACGRGAIIDAIADHESFYLIDTYPRWVAVDIQPIPDFDRRVKRYEGDFLDPAWCFGGFDLAITNPPFSLAFEFAKKMTEIARHSFLLTRLNILEAGKRSGRLTWLSQNTPDVYVLPDRPCFSHTVKCERGNRPAAKGGCKGQPIAWDAATPSTCECGCANIPLLVHYRSAGTDATGYCWLHWDASKLPRTSGLITHLAETPSSERVDRVVER